MSKTGETFENPRSGEYGYVRLGTEDTNGELVISDMRIRPGGAVIGAHIHPHIHERFTVLDGQVGYQLGDKKGVAVAGDVLDLPPGVLHDWWNASDTEEAHVIVEITPAERFERLISTLFGLAHMGKTNAQGVPNLLHMAVISQEYADVVQFVSPPLWIQKALFAVLAPIGRLLGYKAYYPEFLNIPREMAAEIEPLPEWVELTLRSAQMPQTAKNSEMQQ